MLHEELKKLRHDNKYTLKQLASKVGYGTGNLSSYENGKLKAKDVTVIRILMRGYGLSKKEAKIQVALWRRDDIEETYHVELAQAPASYNKGKKSTQTLSQFLEAEGLDKKAIQEIKKEIKKYK